MPSGSGNQRGWWPVLLGLLVWQGWLTLSLFGPDRPWNSLLDDRPILSGRHPLHLYHGYLGARSLYDRGTLCCFDPSFQAGYPKTPVFDSGSRPAELFLSLTGAAYRPAAYKVGLAVCCLLVPLLLALALRGIGLGRGTVCLGSAVGLLVWWGKPGRDALEAGDLDLLLGALAALTQAGMLLWFHREPGSGSWLGLCASSCLGWFAYPPLFALLLPLVLIYYLSVGVRHHLAWHAALLAGLAAGVGPNVFWLNDWLTYWWIRIPLQLDVAELAHRTFHTLWNAPLWGTPADRAVAMTLFGAAVVGAVFLNQNGQRAAARLLGLGSAGFLVLAVAGTGWESFGRLGTAQLLLPGLLFAVPLAVHALAECTRHLHRWSGGCWRFALLSTLLLGGIGWAGHAHFATLAARGRGTVPFALGLSPEQEGAVATLAALTTTEARILWEDRANPSRGSRWTTLLPLLTDRAYLGGLDPDAGIEHGHACLRDRMLAGRPLSDWSDMELEGFCERYNIGWVVCWSPNSIARFRAWKTAELVAPVSDEGLGGLFALQRRRSFALEDSKVSWLRADCQRIALGDVVPNEHGEVVLSLHYQAGLQVSPSRVVIERKVDPNDPIPFVRLRVPGPVARVTLTWEKR